jgi:hypothetical protein
MLNFGEALDVLKVGGKVGRIGWNGKGMYVKKVVLGTLTTEIDNPCLVLKNVKGTFNTWIPSITDLFAEDWEVL